MIKNQLFIGAALLVGVAIGWFMKPDTPAPAAPTPEKRVSVPASKIADVGEEAKVAALRERVSDLESELNEIMDEEASTSRVDMADMPPPDGEPPKDGMPPPGGGPRPNGFSLKEAIDRINKMKTEDPEMYARVKEGMERWRKHRAQRAHDKVAFLDSVDTSEMTDQQKRTHERYQELIAKREDLESKMYDETLTDDEREKIRQEAEFTDHQMRWVGRQERDTLLDQTTKALGFQEEDARAVRDTLQQVISTTDSAFMPPTPGR